MAVLRPSTAIPVGSIKTSSWTAKDISQIRAHLHRARDAGDLQTVERLCLESVRTALEHGDPASAAQFLNYAGGAQFAQFQYRKALATYFDARKLAESAGDRTELGAILFNLSSLYQQVWDIPSALRAAEQGREIAEKLGEVDYKPELLLQLGRLQTAKQAQVAIDFFKQGIQAAHLRGSAGTEARGLDLLGERLRSLGDLDQADTVHIQAYRLRLAKVPSELGFSLAYLGSLRLAQASSAANAAERKLKLQQSEAFTAQALKLQTDSHNFSFPRYVLRHQMGLIRAKQGNIDGALSDFRAAIDETQMSRTHFLPAASSFQGANAGLEESIFDSFVNAAAARALFSSDPKWARESFLAVEINRAASLRQSLEMAEVWRKKLPEEYWETLAELRSEEARLVISPKPHSALSERLELRLSEMEAQAGLDFSQEKFENFDDFRSLKHILEGLRETEVLLSFHLGERESFLWAVTRNSLRLYPLASRSRIRESVKEFRDAVQSGRPDAMELGRRLYKDLFGQLGEEERKSTWLLSLEDTLFELPFAALLPESGRSAGKRSDGSMYLVEKHSIQIVPGAFLLKQQPARGAAGLRMVAVGDPIYNTADPRWQSGMGTTGEGIFGWEPFRIRPFGSNSGQVAPMDPNPGILLNRLVGSGREVESVSQAWGPLQSTILIGADARRAPLLAALDRGPGVIHLATHVLTGTFSDTNLSRKKSFVVLGLAQDAQPDLLSESDIGVLHVPDSLVVMTGCSTASGDILAGAGLQGLTEAWAVAGARAVVATQWPARDLSGDFLPGFYTLLATSSTAEALRRTQVSMIHSGTAYAASSAWASYQLFGGAR